MAAPSDHTMLALLFERQAMDIYPEKVPPHISVMPWFDAAGINLAELTADLRAIVGPITAMPAEEKVYGGEGHDKPGRRVDADGLAWFHRTLYPRLLEEGATFSSPQWLGKRYEPHYTFQKGVDPLSGALYIQFDEMAVIKNVMNYEINRCVKQIEHLRLGI